MTLEELKEAIKANILEILEDNGETVDLNVIEQVQIFGDNSILDSLELVGVIANIEELVQEKTGKDIVIVDENFVVSANSPLENISKLSSFILDKINEK